MFRDTLSKIGVVPSKAFEIDHCPLRHGDQATCDELCALGQQNEVDELKLVRWPWEQNECQDQGQHADPETGIGDKHDQCQGNVQWVRQLAKEGSIVR